MGSSAVMLFAVPHGPLSLARLAARTEAASAAYEAISHEDFVFALTQMDSFIDVSEEDLLRIYGLATGRRREVEAQAASAARSVNPVAPP
ncbi:MAG: hypothetical protein Q8O34_01060 [Rhodocyclaceae bacterium]|nr:hypothetical protein [Rhodocyclaceae bacterium]